MPAGRPTDCTEAVIQRTEKAARLGVTMRNLHKHAGVDNTTFWRWMSATEGPQAEFRYRINAARCARETECIEVGLDVGNNSTGHLWLLERSYGYRKDTDSDVEPVTATARTREEAVDQLAKLPADLLREALERRGG